MRYVKLLLDLYRDLQQASQPRLRLEVGLLKLVYAGQLESIEKVLGDWDESQSSLLSWAGTRRIEGIPRAYIPWSDSRPESC